MKHDGTIGAAPQIRRLADGSIDYEHYAARARDLRAATVARLIRALGARLSRGVRSWIEPG